MKIRILLAKIITSATALTVVALLFFAMFEKEGNKSRSAATGKLLSTKQSSAKSGVPRNWGDAYGNLPLAFEKNLGQTDDKVRFLSRGSGYELFLTPGEAVLSLRHAEAAKGLLPAGVTRFKTFGQLSQTATSVLRLQLERANPLPQITGIDKLPGRTDYFVGNDSKNWRTDVPSYSRVEYRGIYPGVDLLFYGKQHRMEYDFVVAPEADPKSIVLNIEGAHDLRIDRDENLMIGVPQGEVELEKPLIYQQVNGDRREISGNYVLTQNHEVSFSVGAYDRSKPLVIDPVVNYSTYLGGSAAGDVPNGIGIAVDANGDAFIAGQTFSLLFPTTTSASSNTPGVVNQTSGSVFVTELNPSGTQQLYSSYLSGNGGEGAFGVALDTLGNVYVTGQTMSTNFPTTSANAFLATLPGSPTAPTAGHAFISKINPALSGTSSLVYSSYIAGNNQDNGKSIAADVTGNAYIVGFSTSTTGFPTLNGAFTTPPSSNGDAFLTRIDTTKLGISSLIYSTYLGGSAAGNVGIAPTADLASGVAVDSANNAYIVGTTVSTSLPTTTNAFLQTAPAGASTGTVFVSRIDTKLSGTPSLLYLSYLAGATANTDFGLGIALGPNNVAFVTGTTTSAQFPVFPAAMVGTTAGKFPSPPSPSGTTGVAFFSKIDTSISGSGSLTYSVLLGGSNGEIGFGISADTLGNAYIAGNTDSSDFPVTAGAYQTTLTNTVGNAFVAKINPGGNGASDLLYASYFGGTGNGSVQDTAFGIAVDTLRNAYIAGQTASTNFPIFPSNAFQPTLNGKDPAATAAAFVTKLSLIPVVSISPLSIPFGNQLVHTTSASQTVTLTNNTGAAATIVVPPTLTGTNAADFAATAGTPACTTSLAAGASCAFGVTFTPSTSGSAESATLTITYTAGASGNGPTSQTVSLTGTGTAPTVTLNPTATLNFPTPQPVGTTSAALPVTVTNTGTGNLSFTVAPSTGSTEFVVASGTTCTTSTPVGPTSSCTINITFTPSATGSRSATLTITDSASNSPQTITITGTGTNAVPAVTITPSPVPFGGQLVTTTSAAQPVTVRNTGSANLNITAAPTVGGTNGSDFAIGAGSTCTSNATVPPNGTCVINVTFTPPAAASGSRSAMLAIADNAPGSPQQVTLTGTAWDFSLSAQPATVHPGSTATIAVSVTGIGGFTGAVTLSCTAALSCTVPGPVTAPGTGNVTVAAKGFVVPSPSIKKPPLSMHQVIVLTFALMLLFALPATRRFRTRLGLATAAAFLIVISGCSSPLPTPAGTYPVVITGSSGGLSHTITVVVTVD